MSYQSFTAPRPTGMQTLQVPNKDQHGDDTKPQLEALQADQSGVRFIGISRFLTGCYDVEFDLAFWRVERNTRYVAVFTRFSRWGLIDLKNMTLEIDKPRS